MKEELQVIVDKYARYIGSDDPQYIQSIKETLKTEIIELFVSQLNDIVSKSKSVKRAQDGTLLIF